METEVLREMVPWNLFRYGCQREIFSAERLLDLIVQP
jgi:hypothetical protein